MNDDEPLNNFEREHHHKRDSCAVVESWNGFSLDSRARPPANNSIDYKNNCTRSRTGISHDHPFSSMTDREVLDEALKEVAERLAADAKAFDHPLRVAIDGISAAGKTTLARELEGRLHIAGAAAVHVSIDDFHHRAERRRSDNNRARGYYNDALNFEALAKHVLRPLGPGGDGKYLARYMNVLTDEFFPEQFEAVEPGTVVLVDGCFLQAEALQGLFDRMIWVQTSFDAAETRAVHRDKDLLGGEEKVKDTYRERYHAAGHKYIEEHDPASKADLIIHNDDVLKPKLEWRKNASMEMETAELKPVDSGTGS